MSETTIDVIIFIGTFPVLWLVSWWAERCLPDTSELLRRRGESIKMPDDRTL
jgi:hypothetical protein